MLVRFQTRALPGQTFLQALVRHRTDRRASTSFCSWWPWCSGSARRAVNAKVPDRYRTVTLPIQDRDLPGWPARFRFGDGGLPEISARENDALADRESHVCKAVAPGGATPLDFSSNIVRSSCACGRVAEAPGFQPGYAGSIPATRSF